MSRGDQPGLQQVFGCRNENTILLLKVVQENPSVSEHVRLLLLKVYQIHRRPRRPRNHQVLRGPASCYNLPSLSPSFPLGHVPKPSHAYICIYYKHTKCDEIYIYIYSQYIVPLSKCHY